MSIDKIPEGKERGLIFEYMGKGIPVINLLSVKKLCQMNSIAFDPIPLPSSSSSVFYSKVTYNPIIIIVTLLSAFSILLVGVISKKTEERKENQR